jgi:hypothetical protein
MMQTINRVLKSDEVEIDGRCSLSISRIIAPSQPSKNISSSAAKAKILDNTNEYALIELICSCGKKTLVRCDYGNSPAAVQKKP